MPSRSILATAIISATVALTGCGTTETSSPSQATPAATSTVTHAKMTTAQKNALQAARSYIDMSGFSKAGLIGQLSSAAGEGFTKADAKYAANHVGANWKQEAVESAQSYLDMGGFSKQNLYEQLVSSAGEKFTPGQARYAVNKVY